MQSVALQSIKKISRMFFPTCSILLFGSRARNENTLDSDYHVRQKEYGSNNPLFLR